jgi:hypothetical protein
MCMFTTCTVYVVFGLLAFCVGSLTLTRPCKGFRSPCTDAAPPCGLCLRCRPLLQEPAEMHGFQTKAAALVGDRLQQVKAGHGRSIDDRCCTYAYVPSVSALTKIMDARMKMMSDARPSHAISFLTQCCPVMAATNATPVK